MKSQKGLFTVVMLLLLALALAACGGEQEDEGAAVVVPEDGDTGVFENGEGDLPTPLVTEEPPIEAEDMATTEPLEEATVAVVETPTEEAAATEEATATEPATPTEEATATEEATPAADLETTPAVEDLGAMTAAPTQFMLASDLVGLDISNDQGEEVGEVSELLVDQDGMIQQVIFDVGGFLDIGDRPVAVPWDQMQVQREQDTAEAEVAEAFSLDEITVRYTGSAADLENLPAFDTSILEQEGSVLGEDLNTEDEFDAGPYAGLIQVSEFQDYNLLNTNDEDLGEAEDLVVDLSQGMISHALIDFGGFLGVGENTVAVPWDQLQLNAVDGETSFVLDVTPEQLEQAPQIDLSSWIYPVESGWELESDAFWSTE